MFSTCGVTSFMLEKARSLKVKFHDSPLQSFALWCPLHTQPTTHMCCAMLCLVAQSCLTLFDLMSCSLLGSSVHGDSPARILEWVAMPFSRGSSQLRDGTQVSCIVGRFFTEPPGKPKNTGVGSLSLLQGNFPTQESNQVSCIARGFFIS